MRSILDRLISRYLMLITVSGLLLAGFEYLLCAMVSTVDIVGAFTELTKTFPPFLRTLVEQRLFGVMSNAGILAFGWNHPITLALGTAVAIILASRSVAGEIENGAMELVVSQPISRYKYLTSHIIFAFISIALISLLGAGGTLLGQYIYNIHAFSMLSLSHLILNFFLLHVVWYGISLLISVFSREAGRVAIIGFLLALISYFLNVIGQLWDKAKFLLPYSLHTYYSPKDVLVDKITPTFNLILLCILASITISFAFWKFLKRDLP
jgi:ABC-type transport system involved in multi-copper enzyme maturation permease subunit